MSAFLVIDGGSSNVKGIICDENGKILASAETSLMPCYHKDRVEYDSKKLLQAHLYVLSSLLSSWKGEIDSFSITGQRSSFLFMDENGMPLTPVLSWQDGRASEFIKKFDISNEEINQITGLYKTPYYSASKASWLIENSKEISSRKIGKNIFFAPLPTYILFHISRGSLFAIDPTFAQRTLLFDANSAKWSDKLCSIFGIDTEMLPEIVPSFSLSPIELEYEGRKLPLNSIVGDQQAAALPFLTKDYAVSNFGTGAFVLSPCGNKFERLKGILTSIAYSSDKDISYMFEGTVNSCGTFLKWLDLKMGIKSDLSLLECKPYACSSGIFALPAIGGIGSPYWDYSTKTTFSGFNPESDSNMILKASLEGIVFLLNESFEIMREKKEISRIMTYGGLSSIDYIPSFLRDITGLKTVRPMQKEATALGLAFFCASSMGFDCSNWNLVQIEKEFIPSISLEQSNEMKKNWKKFFNLTRSFNK